MNLEKLFKAQQVLRDKINYNESDRFEKIVLALLVEIGELCQEWRGFKFWSAKQEPITTCRECEGDCQSFEFAGTSNEQYRNCEECNGEGEKNYLLEEYVDGKHFILELGIEKGWTPVTCDMTFRAENVTMQFLGLFEQVSIFRGNVTKNNYYNLLSVYVGLGEMLGFTDEQIEQAYFAKNQINHERQENGY